MICSLDITALHEVSAAAAHAAQDLSPKSRI
jgi:hypothetical protein